MNLMNRVFLSYLDKFVVVYIDNILVYIDEGRLYGKLNKCEFWLNSVSYLEHILLRDRISVDPSKILVVKNWHVSKLMMKVRSFLSLDDYY